MKLVKSLLLGSAAGLCAVAGAQAADLPMRKAAPVEYVRVCTAYGAGFFYIPGTDTCLRVGGRARFEYQYTSNRTRNADVSGYRALGRLNLDARTQTAYGTLRTFVRFDIASRTGAYLTSGTQQRYANAFFGTGNDTFGRDQKFVDVDKAFIQFAGITAGRTQSFFDFYAHDLEFIGSTIGSDANTNLLAYTATFGSGFSVTGSMEDPIFRRNPTFATSVVNGLAVTPAVGVQPMAGGVIFAGGTPVSAVGLARDANGIPVSALNLDVIQRNRMPDFVGALRYDQAWGSAQLSGAVHELTVGTFQTGTTASNVFAVNGGIVAGAPAIGVPAANTFALKIPDNQYGFGVQGGLKFNAPQIAPGDVLWLQAAYAQGAGSYTGVFLPQGQEVVTNIYTNRFAANQQDMTVDSFGRARLTESYSATIAFLHYWTPEIRQGVFGSFGRVHFDSALRTAAAPAGAFNATTASNILYSAFAKDYNNYYVGSNIVWSPVRDLDIGVEGVYEKLEMLGGASRGKVFDLNKNPGQVLGGRVIGTDDNALIRVRVQRDF